jgi:Arc/MetJ-type ribon-helix-helix transcriptional regulator
MARLQVEVPEDVNTMVSDAVSRGDYDSDSAMVTAALRLWSAERTLEEIGAHNLGQKWDEAVHANGPYHDPDPILDRLEAKYRSMPEPGA